MAATHNPSSSSGKEDDERTMRLQRFEGLELRLDTPKGRGIFATLPIPTGTIIDISPVLPLGIQENVEHIQKSCLSHYTYNWPTPDSAGKVQTGQAIVLGLGSMFNHSTSSQNVGWERNIEGLVIVFKALRDIAVGEELCISYGAHLWFEDTDKDGNMDEGDGEDVLSNIRI